MKVLISISLIGSWFLLFPQKLVNAHGFGERYDLPVPLPLYLFGAALAVFISFLILGIFARGELKTYSFPTINLLRFRYTRLLFNQFIMGILKAVGVLALILMVVAGFYGSDDPNKNIAPTLTWIIFWVGIPFISILLGDIWRILNPWKTIYELVDKLFGTFNLRWLKHKSTYPDRLGSWPAVLFFGVFSWTELVDPDGIEPSKLAVLWFIYSLITVAGMVLYGKEAWIKNAEFFSIIFTFFSRLSPLKSRNKETLSLRPWGLGLIEQESQPKGQSFLLIFILSTVTFDGFKETGLWVSVVNSLQDWLSIFNSNIFLAAGSVGIVFAPLIFLLLFWITCLVSRGISRTRQSTFKLLKLYAVSLIPIAAAYHIAHYFSYLLIQGQLIIPLISDPFGFEWDLFGTIDYKINIALVNAKLAWLVGLISIIIGHVMAVVTAHIIAIRYIERREMALRSQYPVLLLMVGYTILSLWILAQPLIAH